MIDRIKQLLTGVEGFMEIRLQSSQTTEIAFKGRDLEKGTNLNDEGGFVRALLPGKGWGITTFNNFEQLPQMVKQAIDCSRTINPEDEIKLYPLDPIEKKISNPLRDDFRKYTLNEKKELIQEYNSTMLNSSPLIADTKAIYGDSIRYSWYGNTDGVFIEKERADLVMALMSVAKDDKTVQMSYEVITSRDDYGKFRGKNDLAKEVAEKALKLLKAESVSGGKYTVILDPHLAGVFMHEAFGHLSESDFLFENPKAIQMMKLGKRFGPDILNVVDDGSIQGHRGSIIFDDEGVPCGKTYLIKNGILSGRLHSRETAMKMGEKVTGNCRAEDYSCAPIVRMTNTYVENGESSFDEMLKDIDLGVYACDAYGGQTMLENFSFSAGHAFMIRNGKIAEMVRDVVLQGNLFETLHNIEMIGNDFTWLPGGTCGKGGQSAPVGMGSPHIRIKNVIIGGK
ncbi:TldD/PmbA family protein [bacterium]|nr:TldD/PmbA family protein [bacterium]